MQLSTKESRLHLGLNYTFIPQTGQCPKATVNHVSKGEFLKWGVLYSSVFISLTITSWPKLIYDKMT